MDDQLFFNEVMRNRLMPFIEKCFQTLNPETQFVPGHYLRAIAYQLELVAQGKNRRLMISVPPRHLKSISTSVAFSVWMLGRDPSFKIIGVSYSSDLAEDFGRQCLRIMRSDWYRAMFPRTRLDPNKCSPAAIHTTRGGYRLSTSVGSTLTGKGGDLIIIDDPLKPADAYSDVIRHRGQDWLVNTAISRLDDPKRGAMVLVSQRVHVDDLTGFLLEKKLGWRHLELPAIAIRKQQIPLGRKVFLNRKAGDLLHPERIGKAELDSIRKTVGTRVFECQYQQNPAPPGGTFIKLKWFRRYDQRPPLSDFRMIVQSWDTATEIGDGNDFSVCTTWGITSSGYYLLNVFRKRLLFPDLKKAVLQLKAKFNADFVVVEAAINGKALYQELRRQGCNWIDVLTPQGDKVSRAAHTLTKIEHGYVTLPADAPWLTTFEKELTEFPFGNFDDQVDSFTQFLTVTNKHYFARYLADKYRFTAV